MTVEGFLVTKVARAYPISNTPVVSTLLRAELRPVMKYTAGHEIRVQDRY